MTTKHANRCKIFKEGVCGSKGAFFELQDKIIAECNMETETERTSLTSEIETIFSEIEFDAEQACATRGDDTPEAQEFRRQLQELTEEIRTVFQDRIYTLLDEAKHCV